MKKQIALIIISALAVMSVNAQNVKDNETCIIHERTPICEAGTGVIQPNFDCIIGNCPDFEVKPDIPGIPDIPVIPDAPEVPESPDIPEVPGAPEFPDIEVPEQNVPESNLAMQVFSLVNYERERYGLEPLTYDSHLAAAAGVRSVEIKTLFSHTRPNGTSCFTVLDETGYSYRTAGENIAYGQNSAKEVMTAWMNSDGHRANILGDYTRIGIGVYEQGGTLYWAQMFAS